MNRKAYRFQSVQTAKAWRKIERAALPVYFSRSAKLRLLAAIRATPAFLAGAKEIETRHAALDHIGGSAARGACRMQARGQAGDSFYSVGSAELPVSYAAQGQRETESSVERGDNGAE